MTHHIDYSEIMEKLFLFLVYESAGAKVKEIYIGDC